MGGWGCPVCPEWIAKVVLLGRHHIADSCRDFRCFVIHFRNIVAIFLGFHQILAHLRVMLEIIPEGFKHPACVFRTFRKQPVDRRKGVRHYG